MGTSEEQRFDFGVTPGVEASPTSATRVTKGRKTNVVAPAGQRRTAAVSDANDADATRDAGGDEVTSALKERIARLQQHAHLVETKGDHSGAVSQRQPPMIAELPENEDREAIVSSESLSIAEFYARIKWAIASEFADEVWVTGEIRSLRVSNGHHFFELADQGADGRAAQQLEVACWSHQWRNVQASLDAAGVELEVGRVIRVLGRVSVWEAAGKLRFNLTQLDVEALLGGIAAARRRLLAALEQEGLLTINRQRAVPAVPLRIGLVTSQGSEAQKDFLGQLARSGFAFDVEMLHSLVQGAEAPDQLVEALTRLATFAPDLCVIVRGGGSRNDLAAFDAEVVARAMAAAPFPIWVGIGHTGDHSVADEVANMAFATPTACGEAIAARVGHYWEEVVERAAHIGSLSRSRLLAAHDQMGRIDRQLGRSAKQQLGRHEMSRIDKRARVQSAAAHLVRAQLSAQRQRCAGIRRATEAVSLRYERQVAQRAELLRAFDPIRQLARGWAIVRSVDGEVVASIDKLVLGTKVITRFADGEAGVVVESLHPAERRVISTEGGSDRVTDNEMES